MSRILAKRTDDLPEALAALGHDENLPGYLRLAVHEAAKQIR
jgi:hypothetical protein